MRRLLCVTLSILGLLAAACGAVARPPTPGGKLHVVATFSVIADLVRNVGGDRAEVTTLVGPGRDTHTFEPSPAEAKTLSGATLIFEDGLGFETWLDDLYQASGSRATRVVVTDGIEPRTASEGDEAGQPDPHVWHSVPNAVQMVKNIREALAEADPANAAAYETNANTYLAQLQDLEGWVLTQVKTVPEARRKLVTTHDTFGYFAARYGFEVVGAVLPTSTEGASPSAQQMAQLVEALKASGVPAVFAENVSSNALLDQVATEAGVKVIASLYTDALGPPGSEGDTYVKMMRYNVATIVNALGTHP